MNIGLMHYRIFETDGVSLEMEKWAAVLESMGHKVYFIGGNPVKGHICIPALNYEDEGNKQLNRSCYESLEGYTEVELKADIIERAGAFNVEMLGVIERFGLDLLVPNNIFSLGIHLHIALGLYQVAKETDIYMVCHHHDFYFEREYYSQPTTPFVEEILHTLYPPKDIKGMGHVVINRIAQRALEVRKGLKARVVPNVFDFHRQPWQKDDYNKDFRAAFGIGPDDLLFLQGTRVTNRKAIELAIDVVAKLEDKRFMMEGKALYDGRVFPVGGRIVLLAVGLQEGLEGYEVDLVDYAQQMGVDFIMKEKHVDWVRSQPFGKKVYSLWDAYTACDMITYPSVFEGWGNQFLEGLFAKKPMLIYEYSVYLSDIKPLGFDVVSLGANYTKGDKGFAKVSQGVVDEAAEKIAEILTNPVSYHSMVDGNFEIAKENLSYQALEAILLQVFS